MNERIYEAAKQAGFNPYNYQGSNSILFEKFAELIIEECAQQCWTVSELESKGSVVNECAKRIRKHFGVES